MIGSVLFYVLHPLSRYLFSRPSESSKKDLSPAPVNGTSVWDGGAVTTSRFIQSQTNLLDQCLSPSGGTTGETEERMKEQSPEKEDETNPGKDKGQLTAALQDEPKTEDDSWMSEEQPVVTEKELETRNVQRQDNVEDHRRDEFYVKQNTEDICGLMTDDINPRAQVDRLLMVARSLESAHPVQKTIKAPSFEDYALPTDLRVQESTGPIQEQFQMPCVEEATADETECWDEYIVAAADEMHGGESSKLIFTSSLSNTQNHLELNRQHDGQPYWHFPAGPGRREEVKSPLWSFPKLSYYPLMEPTVPFEGMWRVWEERDDGASASKPAMITFPLTKPSMDFTVMSYNILADDLLQANPELYTHCPLEMLDWNYRCSLILEEINKWAPDILCLQEVQENHYNEHLHSALSQMGYNCVYKRRTGSKTDGCATCYRRSCFSELSVTLLEFFRPEAELLDRHNVGIVLLLQPVVARGSCVKLTGLPLCVANTHLLFNPRRGDVKLAQLAIMLAEISKVVESCKANGELCNLILCGDFNSVPHMPLYQLITTGELYYKGLPAWMISGQEDLSYKLHCHRLFAPLWPSCLGISDKCQYTTVTEAPKNQHQKPGKHQYSHDFLLQLRFSPASCVRPADLELIPGVTDNAPDASRDYHQPYNKSFSHVIRHQLHLSSVYGHILPGSGSPEVTTLHSQVGATVDYIFYTPRRALTTDGEAAGGSVSQGLKLIGSLSLLSEDVLWSLKGLPNDIFPSDHLSLLAKFQMDLNAAYETLKSVPCSPVCKLPGPVLRL